MAIFGSVANLVIGVHNIGAGIRGTEPVAPVRPQNSTQEMIMHWTDVGLLLTSFGGKAPPAGVLMAETKQTVATGTITANAQRGAAWEAKVVQQAQKTQTGVVEQVTVRTQSGVKTRIDVVGRDSKSGAIALTEAKSSALAALTRNQRLGFPEIEQTGGIVAGKGKPGFPGGTQIPPKTKVEIVRP